MQKTTHINDLIGSLPKIRRKKVWAVIINGTTVQYVGATDNLKATAEAYVASKYPAQAFTLKYSGSKLGV